MSSIPERSYTPLGESLTWSERAARLRRMTVKELREILRDRRTIVTLIVMPLVLYPLLSLVCRQFLLAEALAPTEPPERVFAVASPGEGALLLRILKIGEMARGVGQFDFETSEDAIAQKYQIKMWDDLESVVKTGEVDVGVRVRSGARVHFDGDDDTAIDLELIYNPQSALGRGAAEYLTEAIDEANKILLARRLEALAASQRPAPIRAAKQLIKSKEGAMAASIVTVIPLILILMTITGAVYPAIDLTAGERERGTLETLVAAPVPRISLLLAKYFAVWVVACLTATANLIMLAATVTLSGLGPVLFGSTGLTVLTGIQVFGVLLLFAAFFSALLLALSSFARSFKEGQAYLIPLMIVSITPGVVSLMPSLRLENGPLAITPVLNIALLARSLFQGGASLISAAAVIISTVFYSLAAIALAARVFGAEAVLYSTSSWGTLLNRPKKTAVVAPLSSAMFLLALVLPAQFAATHLLAPYAPVNFTLYLVLASIATAVIYAGAPLIVTQHGNIDLRTGLQLRAPRSAPLIAALLLGLTLWPVPIYFAAGSFEITPAMEESAKNLIQQIQATSPFLVVFALGIVPAICEELFFRGFLLSSLRAKMHDVYAILACGALFGLFHLVNSSTIGAVRLLPTTFLGIVLSWICVRTGSVVPGMVMHAVHNSLVLLAASNVDALNRLLVRLNLQKAGASEASGAMLAVAAPVAIALLAVIYVTTRSPGTFENTAAEES